MKQHPLHYYKVLAGYAKLDDSIELSPLIQWRVEIPQSIRRRSYPPDVLLAMLREDNLLSKCHPIYTLSGLVPYNVRLDRIVLLPHLIPVLNELITHKRSSPRKDKLTYEITHECRKIKHVVHIDKDRSNCQESNLRVLQNVEEDLD